MIKISTISTRPGQNSGIYIYIYIYSILWKVSERLVSVRLRRFKECSGVLPTTLFTYWKYQGTRDALLCGPYTQQSALESGQEARIVQIDFGAAFYFVNHQGILYKICFLGIGGSLLCILTQFLSNRSQHCMVDGCLSKLLNFVSGVPLGSVFCRYCYTCKLLNFFIYG